MTGSHEVRGSIPLGSTNIFNKLGHPQWMPFCFSFTPLCPRRALGNTLRLRSFDNATCVEALV